MSNLYNLIDRPLETEKTVTRGAGIYTFVVRMDATKSEIKKAIEKYYEVKVKSINTSVLNPKTRSRGRAQLLKRPMMKKAIVTLASGQTLDVNQIKLAV